MLSAAISGTVVGLAPADLVATAGSKILQCDMLLGHTYTAAVLPLPRDRLIDLHLRTGGDDVVAIQGLMFRTKPDDLWIESIRDADGLGRFAPGAVCDASFFNTGIDWPFCPFEGGCIMPGACATMRLRVRPQALDAYALIGVYAPRFGPSLDESACPSDLVRRFELPPVRLFQPPAGALWPRPETFAPTITRLVLS